MIKEFDFGLFPLELFVAIGSSFEELQEGFVFYNKEEGYVELGDKRFNEWGDANGITSNVINKKSLRKGILVYIPNQIDELPKLIDIISHESTHVIDRLYEFIGVDSGIDTEINAYLVGWVSKNIMITYKDKNNDKGV